MDKALGLLATTTPLVRAIVFDASGVSDVDCSAAKTLSRMGTEFTRRGVRVTVVGASAELRDEELID